MEQYPPRDGMAWAGGSGTGVRGTDGLEVTPLGTATLGERVCVVGRCGWWDVRSQPPVRKSGLESVAGSLLSQWFRKKGLRLFPVDFILLFPENYSQYTIGSCSEFPYK